MDITPELIAEIDFPDSLKGFDKDAVDDFLGQVGTELGRVQYELRNAQARIATLEAELASVGQDQEAASASGAESDAAKATRTILAAQETADRIESDAQAEAERALAKAQAEATESVEVASAEAKRLLAEAHGDAERVEGDARREADELLVAARRRAEDEYDARVADYVRVLGDQEQRSNALADDIDAMEARIGEYRAVLERLVEEVRRVLDDPDELRFRPTLELTAPEIPTSEPEPAPGSAAPADQGDAGGASGDAEWQPGSWSSELADDDAGVGDHAAGSATSEVASVGQEATGPGADQPADVVEHGAPAPDGNGLGVDDAVGDPEQAFDAGELTPAPHGDDFDLVDQAQDPLPADVTRDDLSLEAHEVDEPAVSWDAPEVDGPPTSARPARPLPDSFEVPAAFEEPSVFETESEQLQSPDFTGPDPTGEYQGFEAEQSDHPEATGLPSQLRAFAGDVDSMAAEPYVPKRRSEADGPGEALDLDVADDAFSGEGGGLPMDAPRDPAGVEFVDLDGPGGGGGAPAAFGPEDRYLAELDQAVNGPDSDVEFGQFDDGQFEGEAADDDQKGIRRFFNR
ncbi:MAG: DivIVA domain-containing protein [Microthrixaceae bacterium]